MHACLILESLASHSAQIKASAAVAGATGAAKKSASASSAFSKLVLFTDRAFDTEVDRIEAGATADSAAAAFARVLVAPDAPASVGASYLNARLRYTAHGSQR
jgi:hypothetical protein